MLNYCKAVESSWIIRFFNTLYSVFQGNDSIREDKLKKQRIQIFLNITNFSP